MNPNTFYYNRNSSSSASSSGDKSYNVLIKKAMAKMPMSLNTKKSIDEYYKTAMEKINYKMKAVEKAMKAAEKAAEKARKDAEKVAEKARKAAAAKPKAAKGSKTVKKPRAKKLVGGNFTNANIEEIMYKFKLFHYNCNNTNMGSSSKYLYSEHYKKDLNELIDLIGNVLQINSNTDYETAIYVIEGYIINIINEQFIEDKNFDKYVEYYQDKSYPYSFDNFTKGVAGIRRTFVPKF